VQAPDSIQAVSFDVGGTLIEPWPSVGHVYAEVAADHGHGRFSPATLNRQFGEAWKRKVNFDHSRAAWRRLVRQTFTGLLAPETAGRLLDDLYRRFACGLAWRVFDDVFPTLRALKTRGLKLAVISNWDERLRPLLHDLQLAPFFDALAISVEVGCPKPSPRIFARCVAGLGLPPSSILHVGDSPAEDIDGARRAGMQAVLIRRKPGGRDSDGIRSLAALCPGRATARPRN
jgi:putative hydrolase of the HAD superfamily